MLAISVALAGCAGVGPQLREGDYALTNVLVADATSPGLVSYSEPDLFDLCFNAEPLPDALAYDETVDVQSAIFFLETFEIVEGDWRPTGLSIDDGEGVSLVGCLRPIDDEVEIEQCSNDDGRIVVRMGGDYELRVLRADNGEAVTTAPITGVTDPCVEEEVFAANERIKTAHPLPSLDDIAEAMTPFVGNDRFAEAEKNGRLDSLLNGICGLGAAGLPDAAPYIEAEPNRHRAYWVELGTERFDLEPGQLYRWSDGEPSPATNSSAIGETDQIAIVLCLQGSAFERTSVAAPAAGTCDGADVASDTMAVNVEVRAAQTGIIIDSAPATFAVDCRDGAPEIVIETGTVEALLLPYTDPAPD